MSAFICSNAHLNALAKFATNGGQGRFTLYRDNHQSRDLTIHEIGAMLAQENALSVAHRYNEPPEPVTFRPLARPVVYTPVEIIKACHCYSYQSCEHPGWQDSEARAVVESIIGAACRALPGYEDAPWGIEEGRGLRAVG